MIVGFPSDGNENWVESTQRKEHQFVNKLHTPHRRMKLEREWGHWEIKALHSRRNQPGLDSKPDVSGYSEEGAELRRRRWGLEKEGEGAQAENMGNQGEKASCTTLVFFSCETVKEQYVGLLMAERKSSFCFWFIGPQLSVQVRIIMVLGVNRADWLWRVLHSSFKQTQCNVGCELACLIMIV